MKKYPEVIDFFGAISISSLMGIRHGGTSLSRPSVPHVKGCQSGIPSASVIYRRFE